MQEIFEEIKSQSLDALIRKVCELLAESAPKMKSCLERAYQRGDYREVLKCLQQSYNKVRQQLSSEMQQKIERIVFSSENTPQIEKQKKGGSNMGSWILAIVLLVAIVVIAWVISTKKKPNGNESVGSYMQRSKTQQPQIKYTDKDRDMLELIHLLATITNKTDEFLNS